MKSGEEFAREFVEKLESGSISIEHPPEMPGVELTDEYVEEQIEGFKRLMDSGILDCVADE